MKHAGEDFIQALRRIPIAVPFDKDSLSLLDLPAFLQLALKRAVWSKRSLGSSTHPDKEVFFKGVIKQVYIFPGKIGRNRLDPIIVRQT
jgi:hypothetical protein